MAIKNVKEYELAATPADHSLSVAVEGESSGEDTQALVDAIKDGLASHSSVARVVFAGQAPPDFAPELIVHVKPNTKYEGSGWNYLISFPGFLLFTHAWNGYVYKANVSTELAIRAAGSDQPFATETIDTRWDLRHCDFWRGAFTSSGWYTPFYGALNLVIGFWMIQYDTDATPEFTKVAHDPYGRFIAARVVEMARAAPRQATVEATPAAAPIGATEAPAPAPTEATPPAP